MNTKIITSLGTAAALIFEGCVSEDQVFVIANTRIHDKDSLDQAIQSYSDSRWNFLTEAQERKLDTFIDKCDWDGYEKRYNAYKAQNSKECAKIGRRLMANGKVFQYRLVEKPENEPCNPELWEVDEKNGNLRLRVAGFGHSVFNSLHEYVRWQKENGYGRWISYIFPEGLQSIDQFKPFMTYID